MSDFSKSIVADPPQSLSELMAPGTEFMGSRSTSTVKKSTKDGLIREASRTEKVTPPERGEPNGETKMERHPNHWYTF